MNGDRRDLSTDVHHGLATGILEPHRALVRADRSDESEGDQVQADGLELRVACRLDEHAHHRALGGHQEDADHLAPLLLELGDRVVVQDDVVHRHRNELLDLKGKGLLQLLRR